MCGGLCSCKESKKTASAVFQEVSDFKDDGFEDGWENAGDDAEEDGSEERQSQERPKLSADGEEEVEEAPLEMPASLGRSEVILRKSAFTVSYNMTTHCPNYVAWHLTRDRVYGRVERLDEFKGDYAIGEG